MLVYVPLLPPAIVDLSIVEKIDHDFVLNVAKKTTDARKKWLEGLAKGIPRICSTYAGN